MDQGFVGMSKSFGGGYTLSRRQPSPLQRISSAGASKITYRGYLLKRSNEPYQPPPPPPPSTTTTTIDSDDNALPSMATNPPSRNVVETEDDDNDYGYRDEYDSFPDLPLMPGMFTNAATEFPASQQTPPSVSSSSATTLLHTRQQPLPAHPSSAVVTPSPSNINSNTNNLEPTKSKPPNAAEVSTLSAEGKARIPNGNGITIHKNPIQLGLDAAAAFFGITLSKPSASMEDPEEPPATYRDTFTSTIAATTINSTSTSKTSISTTSLPIRVQSKSNINNNGHDQTSPPCQNDTRHFSAHSLSDSCHIRPRSHRHSAPPSSIANGILPSLSSLPPPPDVIDPRDGHIWRAKYCVLEDGILYFYRNVEDGESPEAAQERHDDQQITSISSSTAMTTQQLLSMETNDHSSPSPPLPLQDDMDNNNDDDDDDSNIHPNHPRVPPPPNPFTRRSSSRFSSMGDLSKSPTPRNYLIRLQDFEESKSISTREEDSPSAVFMWEKRVVLDCVGAVQTAEQEYGPNSFELVGIEDEEDPSIPADTLVLRANDPESMKEWIFQFHRSLASFMRNIMDVFGTQFATANTTTSSTAYLDIEYSPARPSRLHGDHLPYTSTPVDAEKIQRFFSRSPRPGVFYPGAPSSALSHGHGRVPGRRRRKSSDGVAELAATADILSSSPETPEISNLRNNVSPSNPIFRMSPKQSPEERKSSLIPPAPRERPIELSQDNLRKEEGEKKDESIKPAGKYIPPSLRKGQLAEVSNVDTTPTTHSVGGGVDRYFPPSQRNRPPSANGGMMVGRYIPPSQRNRDFPQQPQENGLQTLEHRQAHGKEAVNGTTSQGLFEHPAPTEEMSSLDILNNDEESRAPVQWGGCADPKLVKSSILDPENIPRRASKVLKSRSEAFGSRRFGREVGAISECGIRESNEDAYLIVSDLVEAFLSIPRDVSFGDLPEQQLYEGKQKTDSSLFAIFDGHCGNQAARYAAEKFLWYLKQEIAAQPMLDMEAMKTALGQSLRKLDFRFCKICQEDGREWESGTTALVAMIVQKKLIIANLGDCRGIICRSVEKEKFKDGEEWTILDTDDSMVPSESVTSGGEEFHRVCIWKEIADVHKPSDTSEKARIERANGWITTETEIPIGQLRRMDFLDEDVVGILRRCFSDRYENSGTTIRECKAAPQRILHIHRVCGELAVSRALGDRDFKATFHMKAKESSVERSLWESPLMFSYPDAHNCLFDGDLVANSPDFQEIDLDEEGASEEFLLLASDGLWDVLDADDAARVTRDLLFRRRWTAKRAAARLAELAIHLGSSDNITVIVIRVNDILTGAD